MPSAYPSLSSQQWQARWPYNSISLYYNTGMGAAADQLGNTSSRTITEVKQR